MRHSLTKEQFDTYDADLAEAFELFVQQQHYFEVLSRTKSSETDYSIYIVASLDTFNSEAQCYNASHVFQASEEYEALKREGKITTQYFLYDTMQDAITHANELLTIVQEGI